MQLIESIKSFFSTKALPALGIDKLSDWTAKTTVTLYNQIYPTWYSYKEIAAYKKLDDIFSVVTRLAKNTAAIPLYGYSDSMEDLPESDKLVKFLHKFTYVKKLELYTWLYLRGECFIYKKKFLGVNGFVESVHFLNPSFVTLVLTDEWPQEIQGYFFRDNQQGFELYIPADECIFIKYFNPSDDYFTSWRGMSPVEALCQRLTRMESNMRNSVGQLQNGGVPGVMYAKDLPHTAQSKTVIDGTKTNLSAFISKAENKGAPMVMPGEWGYFTIGSNLVDMASLEMEQLDFKKICNAWGVSARLFNEDGTGSEISDDNAQLGLYTNAIIPAVTMVEDAFNTELVSDFGVGIRVIKHDLDSVYILQQIKCKKALVWRDLPVMIPNRVLEDMGESRIDDPLMDQPLIKTGYEPIDNFEPLPPIE